MSNVFVLLLGICTLSFVLTKLLVKVAKKHDIVDEESERRLHSGTKPRGGGIAIVLCVMLGQAGWIVSNGLPNTDIIIWWFLSYAIALLGLLEDLFRLSIPSRIFFQVVLSALFISSLLSDTQLQTPYAFVLGGVSTIGLVWGINAANFMDGIDGLLSLQAIIVCGCLYFCFKISGSSPVGVTVICLGGGCLGFLALNWEPSKIFLGDIGSYFLGVNMISLIGFPAEGSMHGMLATSILLLPLFTDATLTLIKRVITGQKFWQAHSSHVYQRFVRNGCSHSSVAAALGIVTVIIYLPLAYFASKRPDIALEILMFSCLLSLGLWTISHHYIAKRVNTPV